MNQKTYGIIFYTYKNDKLQLYLKKNTKDYHEDFIIKDIDKINFLNNISAIYKSYNFEKNHMIYLLNKIKYSELFDDIKNYEIVNLKKFNSVPFDKTLKHNRLRFNELDISLDNIRKNYVYRKVLTFCAKIVTPISECNYVT